jgi:hypothetical protein
MNISSEHIAALQALGYTPDEARFLYIVATHSGYFVPRQFLTFAGVKSGKRSDQFTRKLESRGHATWREYTRVGGVYHLFSKTLYRLIDKGNLRNRRRHSTEFIRTRLVLLDFVLANQAYDYLETENDKVSYFCERLGIPKTALPVKAFSGPSRIDPALRYFVDKFPVFLEGSGGLSVSPVTFTYVDAGEASLAGFKHHLNAYKQLLSNLSDFHLLYVANSTVHFDAAERCFGEFANRALNDDSSAELFRYFRLRAAWDQKRYGNLSNEDVEWLNRASGRFSDQDTERLYAAWCMGELPGDSLATRLATARRPRKFRFSPWLVSISQTTGRELGRTD